MGEVQVGASPIASIHGLPETILRPESVEDDAVDRNDNDLNDDFDDAADQAPVLQSTYQGVVHVVLEKFSPLVVFAAPSPKICSAAIGFAAVQDAGTHEPHDDTEHEPAHCEHGVVNGHLLGASVASTTVSKDDDNRKEQGHASDAQHHYLGPYLLLWCPCRQIVAWWEGSGRMENGKHCAQHGEHYQRAGEVDSAKDHFGESHSFLDFLDDKVSKYRGLR